MPPVSCADFTHNGPEDLLDLDDVDTPPPAWHRHHAAWAARRPGKPLPGDAFCHLLAESADRVRHGRSTDPGLLSHALDCALQAPRLPLKAERRRWPAIDAAQRVMADGTLPVAIERDEHDPARWAEFNRLKQAVLQLKRPERWRERDEVDLAGASTEPRPLERARPPMDAATLTDFVTAIEQAAAEIREPGKWSGLGGELAPVVVVNARGWPKGRRLQIEDREGRAWAAFGRGEPGQAPVRICFDPVRSTIRRSSKARYGRCPVMATASTAQC